jgi:hypothetical protein
MIDEIVEGYWRQSEIDYVGLWQIAAHFSDEFGRGGEVEAKEKTLAVVSRLMERGLVPGDYLREGFLPWSFETIDEALSRISTEWSALPWNVSWGRIPTLADPICWFDRRCAS